MSEEDGYHIHPDKIAEEIARGTSVILTSNPRNPTGKVVKNPELAEIQNLCRDRATLVMDEFYGGYNYTSNCDGTTISAAENVEDVDEDDVLIIDGLTKRFRLPGWRIAWIIGPKEFIKAIGSCGSYLDGGANVPFQEAAIPMLEPKKVLKEMQAIQSHFKVFSSPCLLAIFSSSMTKKIYRTSETTSSNVFVTWDFTSRPSQTLLSTSGSISKDSLKKSPTDSTSSKPVLKKKSLLYRVSSLISTRAREEIYLIVLVITLFVSRMDRRWKR